MKHFMLSGVGALVLLASPAMAQDGGEEMIVVTAQSIQRTGPPIVVEKRPVIGLRRQADSALRAVEITSDSLEDGMRRREVRDMLFAAIDRAKGQGINIVTGQFKVVEITRANWKELFPDLAKGSDTNYSDDDESWQDDSEDDDEDYDDDDEESRPRPVFEDDGSTTTLRLKIKTKLESTIDGAELKIAKFMKAVPESGRSQLKPKGAMALTIISPEQYRDEIYRLVAAGAKHAGEFYGSDYGLEITGLHSDVAWEQVSDTELFVFIRYNFSVRK